MRSRIRLGVCLALFAVAPPVLGAAEVGRFAVVQNRVDSLKPGAAQPVPAAIGMAVVLDELETTCAASAAKLTFGEGAVISLGQSTRFRVTRQAVDEATGEAVSTVDLLVGKARVFVSRFWTGRPELRVNTPTAVVGIKGTEVVIDVLEDGTTFVTVVSGSAKVMGKKAGSRDLLAPERVRIAPDGTLGEVTTADDATITALRSATEPSPWAPREMPGQRPTREPQPGATAAGGGGIGKRGVVLNTASAAGRGNGLWASPQQEATSGVRGGQFGRPAPSSKDPTGAN